MKKQVIKSEGEAVEFTFTPKNTGLYKITALINDSKGREHSTELSKWVAGKENGFCGRMTIKTAWI